MKQATAIGASLMTIRISRIVTSNRPSKPRCSARAFGRVGDQQADAEEQSEEHHRQDGAVAAHHLDEIVGNDADEGVDTRWLLRAGLDDLARAARRIAASIWAAAARSTPAPGCNRFTTTRLTATAMAETIDRIAKCPEADALQRVDLAHLGNADDQRREQQRDDQHEQQAQEDLADRLGHIGGERVDPGGVALGRIDDQAEGQADEEADQHLPLQAEAPVLRARPSLLPCKQAPRLSRRAARNSQGTPGSLVERTVDRRRRHGETFGPASVM